MSITKSKGEEFSLDGDFSLIADELGVSIDDVDYSLTEGEDIHTLMGVLKGTVQPEIAPVAEPLVELVEPVIEVPIEDQQVEAPITETPTSTQEG